MKKIMVAIDFSRNTQEVARQALSLAKELDGKLWVIHVTSDEQLKTIAYGAMQFYDFAPEFISAPIGDIELARNLCAEEYKREHQALLNLSAKIKLKGIESHAMLLKGDVAETILAKAKELQIDILVMGSHGHGILRKVLTGSVTEAVLRKAPCGVFIIPSPPAE